jgi:hypothetical protein
MPTGCGAHLTATLDGWEPHGVLRAASRQARARGIERSRDRYVASAPRHSTAFHYPWRSARAGKDLAFLRPRFSQRSPRETNDGGDGVGAGRWEGGGGALRDVRSGGNFAAALRARAPNPRNFMIRAQERSSIPHPVRAPFTAPSSTPHPSTTEFIRANPFFE